MESFEFYSVPRIVFGRGALARLGELVEGLGSCAMIVSNAGDRGAGGSVDRLEAFLRQVGLEAEFWQQRGEPQVEQIEQAVGQARDRRCDLVLGIGGGSAIDAAKAVAGLLTNGGTPLDYMEVVGAGGKLSQPAAPWIAIPTTAGTGAEVTRNAVIGSAHNRFKASLRSPYLLANIALVDPELALPVPANVTASSGMDALCQLIESYTSKRAQPMTDGLALQGLSLAAWALPRVWENGQDLDAREGMALAALLSGMTLANVGLGAVHGFAAPLGANLPVPHGTVCAALLPHVMTANVAALAEESPEHPWLARYATIGRTLAGDMQLPDTVAIEIGIQIVTDLVEQLEIPRLGEFELTAERIPKLAALAQRASSMRYNPVTLTPASLEAILHKSL
jgi:alcohol dehydrogenase class IV